ncbi:MAG: 3'-5' exonuclease [bacterium]|nr:3'-5' exonuclease [bacterium]
MMEELHTIISDYPVIFLDIETNGLAISTEVLEVGALKFAPGELLSQQEPVGIPFHRYVFFDGTPDQSAFDVNHLDIDVLNKEGLPIKRVLTELNDFLNGGAVGGQNIKAFDLPILHYHAGRHNVDLTHAHILDTRIIAQKTMRLPSYSLHTLSSYFDISHRPTHRALDDVKATVQVFRKLIGL